MQSLSEKNQITDTLLQLQIFYEIAMNIGTSLDLHQMLKTSLRVYLRNLNCFSGIVFKTMDEPDGRIRFSQVMSLPRNAANHILCKQALNEIPQVLDKTSFDEFIKKTPIVAEPNKDQSYYIMNLPGFGLLLLIKNGEVFQKPILKSLKQLNQKLAGSCITCVQNETISQINHQLMDEIAVRKTTEEELKELTNELESRVKQRTRALNITNEILKDKVQALKVTESTLRTSEERYRTVMEASPDPIIVYDMKGRVLYLNPSFTRVFGWKLSELEKQIIDFVPEENKAETWDALNKALEQGFFTDFETRRKTKNGNVLEVSISAACYMDVDDNVLGTVVNLRDITEIKKTRELMIQTEKMVSVGGLAAGMAHEINNPLGGILQSGQVIYNRLFEQLPANLEAARSCGISFEDLGSYLMNREIPKLLNNINTSGIRAAKIVEDMLSFSRKDETAFVPTPIDKILDDAIDLASHDYDLTKKFDFREICIKKEYDPASPLVTCIPNQIQQVFFNLFKNAAYAMFQSDMTKAPSEIIVKTVLKKNQVIVKIKDNGPGMDTKVQKRIFEPFFTTKPVGSGTGLGLSVSYFIVVERHNGMLKVDSEPGKGTVFTISLPVENKNQ